MKNLIGYEVVYYHKGNRLYAGNKHRFPLKEAAVNYKNYYESHRLGENLIIEDVEYEGEPLNESKCFNKLNFLGGKMNGSKENHNNES